jgi:pimeloyl-ACP methyl ester carboxylesterase
MPPFTASHRGGEGPPLLCLHGFADTWRTWELVLAPLEQHHEVLAPTLPGHAGGPPLPRALTESVLADAVEHAMDVAGFETAHIAANSLGGFVALQLAERGRARSVVAFAPAGGWFPGDPLVEETLAEQAGMLDLVRSAAPYIEGLIADPLVRRRATQGITVRFEHIPPELVGHLVLGVAAARGAGRLLDFARIASWHLDPERIHCPVRIVWGAEDGALPWPAAAARFRDELPRADWIVLDGVGHCPQLDVPLETAELILGLTGSV